MANDGNPGAGTLANGTHRRGDPDVPEERNPRGHDAQPDPSFVAPSAGAGRPPIPDNEEAPQVGHSKTDDAAFLSEQFDIPAAKAADLIESESNVAMAAALRSRHADANPVQDKPTFAPKLSGAEEPGVAATPVSHKRNQRRGAG
ncbi:MAG: hypothetical protein EOP22_07985 [Hyphomicrobiales bacterium]|nr:MAG: hypothetical protein EOP22_07985 [Hyphomicrobiales bacterium]